MDDTEQVPLDIHLFSAPQREPVKSHNLADMGKGRLGNGYPHTVQGASRSGVDLSFHLFGEGFLAFGGPAVKIGHLPDFRPVGMTQALRTQLAGQADRFRPFEFGGQKPSDFHIVAAAVQPLAGRTDTVAQVFGENKVGG